MQLYKILLVDDEEEVRQSIAQKIDWQELGFTLVGEAENGEDALEKVDALMPDVIFTDISMPYMTG
ncbi:MAG: response regulator, partial [Oscillospiraceae bacterium]